MFIQNTVGFMVGVEQEQNGAIVHGSALLAAVSALSSVKATLHVGPSFELVTTRFALNHSILISSYLGQCMS